MKRNKILICTSANDRFTDGAALLFYSLKKNFKAYGDCDFKVFHLILSDVAKQKIRDIEPRVQFEIPPDFDYCSGIKTLYGQDNQETYLCIESFRQDDYDKVLWIDSDMLCISDFSEILERTEPMLACLTKSNDFNTSASYNKSGVDKFNAGFMVINREHLEGKKTYQDLTAIIKKAKHAMETSNKTPGAQYYKVLHKKSTTFNDQDAIRIYWTTRPTYILPDWYNFKRFGTLGKFKSDDKFFRKNVDNVKIIHYAGKRKPWGNKTDRTLVTDDGVMPGKYDVCSVSDPEQLNRCEAVHIWHDYYEECYGTLCTTDWYKHDKSLTWDSDD
jgi:lipopolysaccharide biosynthesis glycosyltransferase